MTDIFEEVEEAHRKDKVEAAWQKYGWLVWLAGGAIILAVAVNEYLGWQRGKAQAALAGQLETALERLEASDYNAAAAQFSAIVESGGDLAPLAGHYLAETRLTGKGDRAGAIAALQAVAGDDDDPLGQLARLKTGYLQSDAVSLAELEGLLGPLLARETAISALAQELVAAKAFATGDYERARRDFNFLRFAPNAPPGLAQRAQIALSAIPRTGDAESTAVDGAAASATSSRLQPVSGDGGDVVAAGGDETGDAERAADEDADIGTAPDADEQGDSQP